MSDKEKKKEAIDIVESGGIPASVGGEEKDVRSDGSAKICEEMVAVAEDGSVQRLLYQCPECDKTASTVGGACSICGTPLVLEQELPAQKTPKSTAEDAGGAGETETRRCRECGSDYKVTLGECINWGESCDITVPCMDSESCNKYEIAKPTAEDEGESVHRPCHECRHHRVRCPGRPVGGSSDPCSDFKAPPLPAHEMEAKLEAAEAELVRMVAEMASWSPQRPGPAEEWIAPTVDDIPYIRNLKDKLAATTDELNCEIEETTRRGAQIKELKTRAKAAEHNFGVEHDSLTAARQRIKSLVNVVKHFREMERDGKLQLGTVNILLLDTALEERAEKEIATQ